MQILCPSCDNVFDSQADGPEIACPVCGSSFFLESGSTKGEFDLGSTAGWTAADVPRTLGRFLLIDVVGAGAFGSVYKARDPKLDRVVALKVPRAGKVAPGSSDEERFVREARSAAQLRHPAIVSVYEVGQENGNVYLVSEFIEGATLGDLLTAKRLSTRASAELVAGLAEGLHHAHEQRIVHRDVKPSNIIVSPDGRPHLTDFGLAKRDLGESTVTLDGKVLGTPAYMSPEQARGEGHRADRRSDIYSLGVVLYELLTGQRPFRGNQRMLLQQVLYEEPRAPRRLNDRIPRDLETICTKAMAKEPGRRYPTAQALADDLHRFLGGKPVLARPVGRMEKLWRWSRRNPVVAGLAATLIVALTWGFVAAGLLAATARTRANKAEAAATQAEQAERAAERDAQAARQREYYTSMLLAQTAWEQDHMRRLFDLLERQKPSREQPADLRGFEWYYWKKKLERGHLTLKGHTNGVSNVVFSPNGSRVASLGDDRTVRIWNAATGKQLVTLTQLRQLPAGVPGDNSPEAILGIAFSPDGKRLATSSESGKLKLWDVASGKELQTFPAHAKPVLSVAFSPDGKRLATASADRTIKLWDSLSGKEVLTLAGHTQQVQTVVFSPDGKQLASAGLDSAVRLWDAATGRETRALKAVGVKSAVFSPDGKIVATTGPDHTVKLWETDTGRLTATLQGYRFAVNRVSFSPDGKQLATAGWLIVQVWNLAHPCRPALTLRGHSDQIMDVAFSPDGKRLASASRDRTVRLWDAAAGQEPLTLTGHAGFAHDVAFSPDARQLASAGEDGAVKVWDALTGKEVSTLLGHTGPVWGVAFSPDGKRMASASSDKSVKIWDAATGKLMLTLRGHPHGASSVAFSPDGKLLASAGGPVRDDLQPNEVVVYPRPGEVFLWDVATGKQLLTIQGHPDRVFSVAFSPDGKRLATAGSGQVINVWDAATGQNTRTIQADAHGVFRIVFSPDGKQLATAGADQTVKVWDAETDAAPMVLRGHIAVLRSVAFSPDGKRIISGSEDGTAKVWDAVTGQEVLTLKAERADFPGFVAGGVESVAFSPDGKRVATATSEGPVKVWEADVSE